MSSFSLQSGYALTRRSTFLSTLFLLATAQAASFDCGKAKSEIEKLICGDAELSRLDETMSSAYVEALRRADIRQQIIESQRQWLKNKRNACQTVECLKTAYETRIKELGSLASSRKDNEEHEDMSRSLTMTCEYHDYETFQSESVSIAQTEDNRGKLAGVKKFKGGKNRDEHERFTVRPGQCAECTYPSGMRVRVKVGEAGSHPGECGADPYVFMSLWVNERKIASGVWFAGHCREFRAGNPDVSFKISSTDNGVSVQKCHTATQGASDLTPDSGNTEKEGCEPLSACVDFPDISKYPRDLLEYPPAGTKTPRVGEIEILNGSGPVCRAVLDELERDFHAFSYHSDQSKIKLSRPNWSKTSVELPGKLDNWSESIFDFNNDGKLDRVFFRTYESVYMEGSVLLVQPGRSSSELTVSSSPMDTTSMYLPFQMGKVRHNIYDCPPFSQDNDEAGFSMKGRNQRDEVYFRGRYSRVEPFGFQGTNYICVSTVDEITKDFVAVLKPLPDGTFQEICLFRRVSENF